jgi:hypothetical protein
MSQRNGDKARFGKKRKKKLLRRKRNLVLRQSLGSKASGTTDVQVPEQTITTTPTPVAAINDSEVASQ